MPTPIVPAGYALQYCTYFGAIDFIAPGLEPGKDYGAFFYRLNYTGAVAELLPGADPCVIDTSNETSVGRKSRKATFQVFTVPGLDLSDLFSDDDRDFFALVTEVSGPADEQGKIHFAGYLSPFDAAEPISLARRPIEFSAVDGLGSLSDFAYLQFPIGLPPVGPATIAAIIRNALRWLGYELPVWFSMHLVEEKNWLPPTVFGIPQHPGPWVDALSINKADPYNWFNDRDGSYKSCAEVLDNICATFRLRLLQHEGIWKFICVDEFPGLRNVGGNNTILRYWNAYDIPVGNAAPVKRQITENPLRFVNSDTGSFVPVMGAKTAIQAAKRRYKLAYAYGNLFSKLTNGGIMGNEGEVPQGWTKIGNVAGSCVIKGDGTQEDPTGIIILGMKNGDPVKAYQTDQKYDNRIVQKVIFHILPKEQRKLSLSGIYRNFRTAGGAMEVVAEVGFINNSGVFQRTGDNVAYALQSTGKWASKKSRSTVNYLHFTNLQPDGFKDGKPMFEYADTQGDPFSIESETLPRGALTDTAAYDVQITLVLWPGPDYNSRTTHAGSYTIYRNIKMVSGDGTLVDMAQEVLITQVKGLSFQQRKKSEELALTLGDQTTAVADPAKPLRSGALLRADNTPTTRWMMANGGHVDKIQNQVARNALITTAVPRRLFDGTVAGDCSPLDMLVAEDAGGKTLSALSHRWSLKNRMVTMRAVEVPGSLDYLLESETQGKFGTDTGVLIDMGTSAQALVGDFKTPSVPTVQKTDPITVFKQLTRGSSRVPIQPEFTDANEVTLPLRSSGRQSINPQFEEV